MTTYFKAPIHHDIDAVTEFHNSTLYAKLTEDGVAQLFTINDDTGAIQADHGTWTAESDRIKFKILEGPKSPVYGRAFSIGTSLPDFYSPITQEEFLLAITGVNLTNI